MDHLRGLAEGVRHLGRKSRESQTCFRDEALRGKAKGAAAFRTDQAVATFAACDKILYLQCETQHEGQVKMIEFRISNVGGKPTLGWLALVWLRQPNSP